MKVISISYNGTSHWKVAQALKKTLYSFRRPSGRKEYNDGVVSLHGFLLFSAAQSDGFTWASKERMSREFAAALRTTERRLRKLTESGFIKAGLRWIGGKLRRGYYILAQQDILEALQTAGITYRLLDIDESAKKRTNSAPTTVSTPAPAPPPFQEMRQVVRQLDEGGIYRDRTPKRTFSPPCPPAGGASRVENELPPERPAQQADPQGNAPKAAPVSVPEPPPQVPACAGFTEPSPAIPESSPQSIAVAEGQAPSSACATQETVDQPQLPAESPAWQAALDALRQSISQGDIDLWLKPIHALETKDGLQLDCEDEPFKVWVTDKFHKEIERALKETGFNGTFFYSVGQYKNVVENTLQQCATQETVDQPQLPAESPAWQAALDVLRQSISQNDIDLWLKPIHALETKDGLQLDCEDEPFKVWVIDKFHKEIERALKETGFNGTFFYSVGQHKGVVENTLKQQDRMKKREAFNARMNELSQLDWKEQFRTFVRAYPQKGLPAGLGRVEKLFGRLYRRGNLPTIDILFKVLNTLKRSNQWTKDGGKYVIGIEKFLRNAPWNDYELWSRSFV